MKLITLILSTSLTLWACFPLHAETSDAFTLLDSVCPRPAMGAVIQEPPQVKSVDGALSTTLVARNVGMGPEEPVNNYDYRFCLLEHDNPQRESPVLRVDHGDSVQLRLVDRMSVQEGFPMPHVHAMRPCPAQQNLADASIASVNLHYHGLNIPPTCGADDVLTTIIQPDDAMAANISELPYRFSIPSNEPPGLFWYHPHVHGIAQQHLLGGMTGVMPNPFIMHEMRGYTV